jgi:hypothetical protein
LCPPDLLQRCGEDREAGGWASAATVEQVYGHVDVHDPVFTAALEEVWGTQP